MLSLPPIPSKLTGQQLNWSIWGLCKATGKVRLKTADDADGFVERVRKKYGPVMGYYRCPTCHDYHLTRKNKKRRTRP